MVPSPVMNSVTYNHAVSLIKTNKQVKDKIGRKFQVMNCNGKIYPYLKDVKFDIVLFGTNQNGKVKVTSRFDRPTNTWEMKKLDLYTRDEVTPLL